MGVVSRRDFDAAAVAELRDDEDVPLVLENVSYGNDVRVLELSENVDLAVQHLGAVELGLGDGLRARGVSNVPDRARSTRKETS